MHTFFPYPSPPIIGCASPHLNTNMFRDIEHYTRFQRVLHFQKFVNNEAPNYIFEEFIRLSRMIYESDFDTDINESNTLYDYDNMTLFEDDMFGIREVQFYTGIQLNQIRIIIPCMFEKIHQGINCKIIDHLLGIGCPQCAEVYGISGLFPRE